jgi:hypothetical protein
VARAPALLIVLALVSGCASSSGRGAYVKANERLFRELPRFPGATLRSETSAPYFKDDSGRILGYGTRFDLALPTDASSAQVALFFEHRLEPRWLLVETLAGPVLNFRNGRASVSVNLEGASDHTLELGIDHDYYGKLGRCGVPGGCAGSPAWAAIRRAILACHVKAVSQTHSRRVSVTLKNGRTLTAAELKIDAILDVLHAARCRPQPSFATE